jgi:hypothetical protein
MPRTVQHPLGVSVGVLLAACCGLAAHSRAENPDNWEYRVKRGDTLIGLANRYFIDPERWREAQALNGVRNPRRLVPGATLLFPVQWLRATPVAATLLEARGKVEVVRSVTGESRSLKAGDTIAAGDRLATGPGASVTLGFADGSQALVLPDSTLGFRELAQRGAGSITATHISLDRGRVETRVKPFERRGSRYTIETPVVNMGVRGTDFRVGVDGGEGKARSEVLDGTVSASNALGESAIEKGFGTVIAQGQAPQPPIPILPAPNLEALPPRVERLPVRFAWKNLEGAASYRVQIAQDASFHALIAENVFATPEAKFADLADGSYTMRVRAVDTNGLEGVSAERTLEVNARPEAPFLQAPEDNSTVRGDRPALKWAQVADAASYRFQISLDNTFKQPLVDIANYARTEYTAPKFAPGEYYWRIASLPSAGEPGPFGDPQRFTLKAIPRAGGADAPNLSDKTIVLKWKAGEPGQKYHLQVARNAAFEPIWRDEKLDVPTVELQRPAGGELFARIRVLDADGFTGPFGSLQRLQVPPQYPQLNLRLDERNATFSWPPGLEGQKLHIQFARDRTFEDPLIDAMTQDTSIRVARPVGPNFFARVARVDADGYAAPFSAPWPVAIETLYPSLSEPIIERGKLNLAWTALQPGQRLHLQIARDAGFSDLSHDALHDDTQLSMGNPDAGEYFLRVAVVDSDGFQSPFDQARRFEIPRNAFPWPVLLVLPLFFL